MWSRHCLPPACVTATTDRSASVKTRYDLMLAAAKLILARVACGLRKPLTLIQDVACGYAARTTTHLQTRGSRPASTACKKIL